MRMPTPRARTIGQAAVIRSLDWNCQCLHPSVIHWEQVQLGALLSPNTVVRGLQLMVVVVEAALVGAVGPGSTAPSVKSVTLGG